jgi:hypothetical protein
MTAGVQRAYRLLQSQRTAMLPLPPLPAGGEAFHANNVRVKASADPLGALGDLGWYCIRAILWAYDYETPLAVQAHPCECRPRKTHLSQGHTADALHWHVQALQGLGAQRLQPHPPSRPMCTLAGAVFNAEDVPIHIGGELLFPGARRGHFECGFDRALTQFVEIGGTLGTVRLDGAFIPGHEFENRFVVSSKHEFGWLDLTDETVRVEYTVS